MSGNNVTGLQEPGDAVKLVPLSLTSPLAPIDTSMLSPTATGTSTTARPADDVISFCSADCALGRKGEEAGPMLECSLCGGWNHFKCVNLSTKRKPLGLWACVKCEKALPKRLLALKSLEQSTPLLKARLTQMQKNIAALQEQVKSLCLQQSMSEDGFRSYAQSASAKNSALEIQLAEILGGARPKVSSLTSSKAQPQNSAEIVATQVCQPTIPKSFSSVVRKNGTLLSIANKGISHPNVLAGKVYNTEVQPKKDSDLNMPSISSGNASIVKTATDPAASRNKGPLVSSSTRTMSGFVKGSSTNLGGVIQAAPLPVNIFITHLQPDITSKKVEEFLLSCSIKTLSVRQVSPKHRRLKSFIIRVTDASLLLKENLWPTGVFCSPARSSEDHSPTGFWGTNTDPLLQFLSSGPTTALYVGGLSTDTAPEQLSSFFMENLNMDIPVSQILTLPNTEAKGFKSFKLEVERKLVRSVLDPSLWPIGVTVNHFISPKRTTSNVTEISPMLTHGRHIPVLPAA